jgi:hypothetical protein
MKFEARDSIAAEDPLVLDPVFPGDSLLLLGPSMDLLDRVFRRMIARTEDEPAAVVVSTRDRVAGRQPTVAVLEAAPDCQAAPIDCAPRAPRGDRGWKHFDWRVSFSTELTGIEIAVSRQLDEFRRQGIDRPWLVVDAASLLRTSNDSSTIFRFVHSLLGTVESYGGVGVCAANGTLTEEAHLEQLKHLSDGTIEVRLDRSPPELRRRGLGDADHGWRSIDSCVSTDVARVPGATATGDD